MVNNPNQEDKQKFELCVWMAMQEVALGKISFDEAQAHMQDAMDWVRLYGHGLLDAEMKYPRLKEEVEW